MSSAVAAGLAAVTAYREPGFYEHIHAVGRRLCDGLNAIFDRHGVAGRVQGLGARFGIYFGVGGPVRSYRDAVRHQREQMLRFIAAAIRHGVYFHDYGGAACHHGFCAAMTLADADEALEPAGRGRATGNGESPMRIAIGQLWQETNTFNPLPTTRADFEAFGVVRGAELVERMADTNELGGFIQSLRAGRSGRRSSAWSACPPGPAAWRPPRPSPGCATNCSKRCAAPCRLTPCCSPCTARWPRRERPTSKATFSTRFGR